MDKNIYENKNNFSNLNIDYEIKLKNKNVNYNKYENKNLKKDSDDIINLDNFNLNNYNLENLIYDIRLTQSTGNKEENNDNFKKFIPRHKYLKPEKSNIANVKNTFSIKLNDNLEIHKVKSYKLLNSDMAKMVKLLNKEKEEEDKTCLIY